MPTRAPRAPRRGATSTPTAIRTCWSASRRPRQAGTGPGSLRLYRNDQGRVQGRDRHGRSDGRVGAPCASRPGSTSMATAISTCSSRSAIAPTRSSATIRRTIHRRRRRRSGSPTRGRRRRRLVRLRRGRRPRPLRRQHGRRRQRASTATTRAAFTDVAEAAGRRLGRPRAARRDRRHRSPLRRRRRRRRPVRSLRGELRAERTLFLNRGGGRFEDVSTAWGIAIDGRYDTCALGDFDNDGRIDLYVNGTVTGGVSYRDYLFRNTGTRFEDVTPPTPAGAACEPRRARGRTSTRDGDEISH